MGIAVMLSIASTVGLLLPAYLLGMLVDEILVARDSASLAGWLAIASATAGGLVVAMSARGLLLNLLAESLTARMRSECYDHVLRLPLPQINRQPLGELVSRIADDTDRIWTFMTVGLSNLVTAGLTTLGAALLLLWTDSSLAFWWMIPLLLVGMLSLAFGRRLKAGSTETWARWGEMVSQVSSVIPAAAEVKLTARETAESAIFASHSDRIRRAHRKVDILWSLYVPAVVIALGIGLVGLCWTTGSRVLAGTMTVGAMVTVVGYTLQLHLPLRVLAGVFRQMFEATAAARRVFDLLAVRQERRSRRSYAGSMIRSGRVELQNVSFAYPGGKLVLHNFHLIIEPGERVGLSGPSGSGKTTTALLIAGLLRPTSGRVLVDGVEVEHYDSRAYRLQIGYVPERLHLLPGSIADNIACAWPLATMEEVRTAAQQAGAADFIEALPDAYATRVYDRGSNLSAGQRQRIGVARALMGRPRILLLDEPAAHLDAEAAETVWDSLRRLSQICTTLVISHDPADLQWADRTVDLRDFSDWLNVSDGQALPAELPDLVASHQS